MDGCTPPCGSTRLPRTLLCSDSVLLGLAFLKVFCAGSAYALAPGCYPIFLNPGRGSHAPLVLHPVSTELAPCERGHSLSRGGFRRMGQAVPERSGWGSRRLWRMWGVKAYHSPWQHAPRSGRSSDYFSLSSLAFWVWNGKDCSRSPQRAFGVILPLSCVNRLRPHSVYTNLIKWLLSHTCIFSFMKMLLIFCRVRAENPSDP